MPRELPEGVKRFEVTGNRETGQPEMVASPNPLGGGCIRASDLPRIEAAVEERVREGLQSDEAKEAVADALRDTDFTVVLDQKLEKLPSYGGEITWAELADVALKAASSSLDSYTEQGGGEQRFTFEEIRERLLGDEAIEADAGARWFGINDNTRKQSLAGLTNALAAAFPRNGTGKPQSNQEGSEAMKTETIEVCAVCGIPEPQRLWSGARIVAGGVCAHRKTRSLLLIRGTDDELIDLIAKSLHSHVSLEDEDGLVPLEHYKAIAARTVEALRQSNQEETEADGA